MTRAVLLIVALLSTGISSAQVSTTARRPLTPSEPDAGPTTPVAAPLDCAWEPVTPSPVSRFESLTVVIDGEIHLFGGFENQQLEATSRVDVYDPATDTWRSEADLPGTPVTHSGIAVAGREVWIAGGFVGDSPGPTTDAVWRYDVDADTWTPAPSLPEPRGACQLVREGRCLYLFGGVGVDKDEDEAVSWSLDLTAVDDGWSTIAPLPEPRNHLGGIAYEGGVYAIGGQIRHDTSPLDTVFLHRYDPPTDTWTRLADLPEPRSHFEPATFLWDGKIVICGGRSLITGQSSVQAISVYDVASDTWSDAAPLPTGLNAPSVQLVGPDVTLIGGALGSINPQDDAYRRSMASLVEDVIRHNAGGPAVDSASVGIPVDGPLGWCADAWFESGSTFSASSGLSIAMTGDDELYRSERNGGNGTPSAFGYEVPLDPGLYRVTLRFAEIFWGVQGPGGAGRRVFDVSLEGEVVLDDYDIFADVGAATAVRKDFAVAVVDGVLDIDFVGVVDQPKLSAYEVERIGDLPASVAAPARDPTLGFALVAGDVPPGAAGVFVVADRRVVDGDLLTLAARGTALARASVVATLPARAGADGRARFDVPTSLPVPTPREVERMASIDAVFVHAGGVAPARIVAERPAR